MNSHSTAQALDARHALDDETRFRLVSRRNRLFGQWAADLMNLSADESLSYAKAVVAADLDEPGDDDVLRKVEADLSGHGVRLTRAELRERLDLCMDRARQELTSAA